MTIPSYPAADFDRGSQLLAQLGSFWFNIFEDRDVAQSYLRASGNEHGQTYLGFLEAAASLSRFTVPIFHTENWHLLTFTRSDANSTASAYQAGDLVYGPQSGDVVGRDKGFVQTYNGTDRLDQVRLKLPDNLADVPYTLQNLSIFPSLVLTAGVDFDIDEQRRLLRFVSDPFENPLIPSRDVVDEAGNIIDKEIALWIYRGDFDLEYVYVQFGYALGLKLQSSSFYKDLLNAYWDMHVLGPSRESLENMLSALSGAPLALDSVETVEVVQVETTSQLIVTSTRVYRVPLAATVVVAVGDVIHRGDPITDAIEIIELGGHNPDLNAIPVVSLSDSFLSGGYFSEISFKNVEGQVQYLGSDNDGKTIVCLEASGFPDDLKKFWDLAQERGKVDGATLANLLDIRSDPVTEPGPDNLPATLNPLQFVLDNILKNNLFIIRARRSSFAVGAPGISLFRLLRDVIPPHTTYIVFVEVDVGEEAIDLTSEGGDDEIGVEEAATPILTTGAIEEEAYEAAFAPVGAASYADEVVLVRAVALDCN